MRPPQSYSAVTATYVAAQALQLYAHPSFAGDTRSRLDRARNWLASRNPSTTEERVSQLRGQLTIGADRATIDKDAAALKSVQQSDGGWSSRSGLASDAYSTGEALIALQEAGMATSDAAWRRGIDFLVKTQAADGSWHVTSRIRPPAPVSPPYFETGYPYGHDQFISAMGAARAISALAAALGPAQKTEVTPLPGAEPTAEPWVETAAFGSVSDLKELLDRGLNPNAVTKSGGTTLLMAVQPDLQKTKLLVERGANVNARSKTRYSALLVASWYREASPTMRYLLDHGATVSPGKGQGSALFNATPTTAAAFAGNTEILPRLKQAGDKPDSVMMLLGIFPTTPLLNAVFFGDSVVARAVLEMGAGVDTPDRDGITPLGWAAIGFDPEVARALIERGADVNHVDQKGMTPLLYAASIDFGDSSVIDLLLKSGANPKARTPEGLTTAQLIHKYGHNHLLKSISQTPVE